MAKRIELFESICIRWASSTSELVVLLAIIAPHALYAFIWFKPQIWQYWFQKRAVDVFALCGAAGKGLQFSVVLMWFASHRSEGLCLDLASICAAQWIIGAILLIIGQALNITTYRAIGRVGVYYGSKLGYHVPWHEGFPFSAMSHPQYIGSAMTLWGAVVLVWQQAPFGMAFLALFWTFVYFVNAIWEEYY